MNDKVIYNVVALSAVLIALSTFAARSQNVRIEDTTLNLFADDALVTYLFVDTAIDDERNINATLVLVDTVKRDTLFVDSFHTARR